MAKTVHVLHKVVHGVVNPLMGMALLLLKHAINMDLQEKNVGQDLILKNSFFGRLLANPGMNVSRKDILEMIKVGIFLIRVQHLRPVDLLVNYFNLLH